MEIESVSNPPEHCSKTGKRGETQKQWRVQKQWRLKTMGFLSCDISFPPLPLCFKAA